MASERLLTDGEIDRVLGASLGGAPRWPGAACARAGLMLTVCVPAKHGLDAAHWSLLDRHLDWRAQQNGEG